MLCSLGCSFSVPPEFRLNTEGRDPEEITATQKETITDALATLFGTPDEPAVSAAVSLLPLAPVPSPRKRGEGRTHLLQTAAGPAGSDAKGNPRGLYRRHCAVCHGISGDGAGPIAALMNPFPRDFRTGVYKYTSTTGGAKAVWEDLETIVRLGMPGTSMPSFGTLSDGEIEALVEYVQYLSLRGETELFLLQLVVDLDEYPIYMDEVIDEGLGPAVDLWAEARSEVVVPPQPPPIDTPERLAASIARGRELFSSKNARCTTCHGAGGRGDGEQADELYDQWNRPKKGATAEQTADRARLFRLPIRRVWPRDFTEGVFRGGDRPADLYRRVYAGIKGTPMPAGGPTAGSSGVLTYEEIWHVVNYVRSLSGSGGGGL